MYLEYLSYLDLETYLKQYGMVRITYIIHFSVIRISSHEIIILLGESMIISGKDIILKLYLIVATSKLLDIHVGKTKQNSISDIRNVVIIYVDVS